MTETIRRMERLGLRAWPAFETTEFGGWVFRAAGGYTGRANSATALAPVLAFARVLPAEEAFFADRSLPCRFRLTELAGAQAPSLLRAAGYVPEKPTLVLTAPLAGLPDAAPSQFTFETEPRATADWSDGHARATGLAPAQQAMHETLLARIEPDAAFATLSLDGAAVAYGLAVRDGEGLGLFDLVTVPESRRNGAGRRLVQGLLAWGRAGGARLAWLQVTDGNEPALALYDSFGFGFCYRYEYWRRDAG